MINQIYLFNKKVKVEKRMRSLMIEEKFSRQFYVYIYAYLSSPMNNLKLSKIFRLIYYERVERTKFLLGVIYGSSRRHSNSCNTLKNWKKLKYIL